MLSILGQEMKAIEDATRPMRRFGLEWERTKMPRDRHARYTCWWPSRKEGRSVVEIMRNSCYKGKYYPWGLYIDDAIVDAYHSVYGAMLAAKGILLDWELAR